MTSERLLIRIEPVTRNLVSSHVLRHPFNRQYVNSYFIQGKRSESGWSKMREEFVISRVVSPGRRALTTARFAVELLQRATVTVRNCYSAQLLRQLLLLHG